MKTTMDRAGRIVIPKAIREQAGLHAGAPIEIRVEDDEVVLTPAGSPQRLERRGRYVTIVRQDAQGTIDDEVVEAVREEIWRERASRASAGPGA
jgi:AbrB family looped-hinge helix DNA binding protein